MGSMRGANAKGFIADDLFAAILAKLQREFTCRQLHFYNWTEPLLHPRIAEYCRLAADAGFHVHLSSNLNHLRHEQAVLASGIKTFRISLSGFTQETYRIGHRGGDVENVKTHMRRLADAKAAAKSRTRIHVYFHKYRHNVHEEALMERFAKSLGFDFQSDWAFLMPLEKILAYVDGSLSEDERRFADERFIPPLDEALELVQREGGRDKACALIEQLVLDHRGRVMLCCGSFENAVNVIGEFLELDWPTMQAARYAHSMCGSCTAVAAHAFCTSVSDPALRAKVMTLAERSMARPPRPFERDAIALPILNGVSTTLARTA
jgi:MoaA/NifB/PqqE/SkfB family radical SAM enzyme